MLGWRWSRLTSLDVEIRAAEAAEEAEEEKMDNAAVQAAEEAEYEEEQKIIHRSHSRSHQENRHIHRPERDRQEAVSTARLTTMPASALNSPQTKRHSCLSKPRKGRTTTMVVMTKTTMSMESTTMVFVGST